MEHVSLPYIYHIFQGSCTEHKIQILMDHNSVANSNQIEKLELLRSPLLVPVRMRLEARASPDYFTAPAWVTSPHM